MKWKDVLGSTRWLSLRGLDPPPVTIDEYIVKLGDEMYTVPLPYNEVGDRTDAAVPYAGMVVWAVSEGAARRVLSGDIEAYDGPTDARLPEELRQFGERYGEIKAAAKRSGERVSEYAAYRIARDGLFICACVDVGRLTYHFLQRKAYRKERPCAVTVNLRLLPKP